MVGRLRGEGWTCIYLAAALALVPLSSAQARQVQQFSVPGGRLSDALIAFSEQAGISIAIGDPHLDTLHTPGINGRYELTDALRRLLEGSGYGFVFVDGRTVRLVRQATKPQRVVPRRPNPVPQTEEVGPDIVVTATKQRLGLINYPASISVVEPDRTELARAGGTGTGYILGKLPQLTSTNLGPGRNKIFIRGIADSSFNGTSQSTISQYLNETRLIYSAPDPDLALYDVAKVEVLEGPQGTLYGAGTLGGIIRVVPNAPDMQSHELDLSAGLRSTKDGALGGDGAVIGNLPLIKGRLALRAVVYKTVEGGYIEDSERGLKNINRNQTSGVRAQLRWQPDIAWAVDLSALSQNVGSRDGQYTLLGEPDLTRRSAIAQPFDNDYRLVDLTVRHNWGKTQLVSATGYAHHSIESTFDATPSDARAMPTEFTEVVKVALLSHETRVSGMLGTSGSWLAGIGLVYNDDRVVRRLGTPESPSLLTSISNATLDLAAFGEVGMPVADGLVLTIGGRLSYVRQTSEFIGQMASKDYEPERSQKRFLPSTALSWSVGLGLLVYGRFQQGYRPGGLQVTGSSNSQSAERFEADRVRTAELGLRFGMDKGARLSGSVAASLARWVDVQADLVGLDGLPYVANIGSGRVRNLAVSLAWRPRDFLSLEAAGFLNSSKLSDPSPDFADANDRDLPNISDEGWRLAAKYNRQASWATITIDAAVRYVGRSKLAIRAPFALFQGRYYSVTTGARLGFGDWGLSLDIDNLLNARANTFSFGNPFSVAEGMQQTPMRPRSIRIGFDARF